MPFQWRHNKLDGVLNHRRLDWLFNPFVQTQIKKTSKLTGVCEQNSPVTDGFPSQIASNVE